MTTIGKINGRKKLFITDICYTPYKEIKNAAILCKDNIITAIGNLSAFQYEDEIEIYDLRGCCALPGFIDTHIHGTGGFDVSNADVFKESYHNMCNTLAQHGVIYFLPTIVALSKEKLLRTIDSIVHLMDKNIKGASAIGIRLEGPYISKYRSGAQEFDEIREIDFGELKEIISASKGKLKMMTFAPELKGSIKLVEILIENNIIPSMGHSIADENIVIKAIDAGANHCTHIFNGMPIMHHRSVGLPGVVLTDNRVTAELIADGYHVHPRIVEIVSRVKPKDKIIGISDSTEATGLQEGEYKIGDTKIIFKNGHVKTESGIIAGSAITLEVIWNNLIKYSQLNIKDATACLTTNPAKLLNIEYTGEVVVGKKADIVFFNIKNNKLVLSVKDGKIIYSNSKALT